ncbi:MAG TPA: DUF1326 domain-containing protein [Solimonas sp.]|nr:DUF1326 domain-containing protein [Solimonas sp.]
MQGWEFANCNCNWGCPCQFNQLPSHGNCRAHTFVQIEKGRFGDVPLDGLRWGIMGAWPGPIHLGNGTWLSIVDERADAKQRAALEAVSHGKETEPGTLIWQVFSTMVTNRLPTVVKPIELSADFKKATAKVHVPGLIDSTAEPMKNPVTGAPHRARVTLPEGFEFTEAEFATGKSRTTGPIELQFDSTHAHLARIHWSNRGVVR